MKLMFSILILLLACDGSPAVMPQGDGGADQVASEAAADARTDTLPGDTIGAEATSDVAPVGLSGGLGDSRWHEVPGGTFNRNGDPALPATVSTFRLDDYEVTVGRFRKFVEAGHGSRYDGMEPIVLVGGANPNVPGSGWWRSWDGLLPDDIKAALVSAKPFYTWTLDSLGGHEDFPIAGVNWAAAHFFCIWDGGRLPTDLEWQYAATGGNLQRTYPWGASSPDSSHASFNCTAPCTIADLGTYASKPAGSARWGQFNMAGNMSEWTFDGYDPAKPPTVPCVNCATLPEELKLRIVRGGNASSAAAGIETKAAAFVDAKSPPSFIGFRCAR